MQTFDVSLGLAPGTRVGELEIERFLGKGGAGHVYCARRRGGPRVALKLMPRALLSARPELGAALQREFQRLQLLRHPRIVEAYEYGVDAPGAYYTMELLDGPELKTLAPMPWRRACLLLRDV